MNIRPAILVALLVTPAWAQNAPNAALYEMQNCNAAVVGNLVNQTLEYQDWYALRVEAMRNREAAQRQTHIK
jgi:hypothetical protein